MHIKPQQPVEHAMPVAAAEVPPQQFKMENPEFALKLDQFRKELEQRNLEVTRREIKKLQQERMESETLLEGRAAEFSVGMEK